MAVSERKCEWKRVTVYLKKNNDTKIVQKSRMSGFSCREYQGYMKPLGIYIGRYGPVSDFWCILKAIYIASILAKVERVSYIRGSREIPPMPSLRRPSVDKTSVKKV